jgi:amino acid transporter
VVASSRLLFAVARDGVFPLSSWIGRVDGNRQPRNAVTVMFVFAAVLLFSIIPSQVAFTSLISAGGVPTIAAYALIAALRLTCTPHAFKTSYFYLGRWAKPMYLATVLFNGLVFAVRFPFSSSYLVFRNDRWWVVVDHDLAVLLPCQGFDVQLCMHHLWLSIDLRHPLLVLHTSG